MPQLDQTGPQGMGPETGKKRGKCSGAHEKIFRRGCGKRFCRRFYSYSKSEEREMLSQEIEDMKEYIKSMQARLEELGDAK